MTRILTLSLILSLTLFHSCEMEREMVDYCSDMGRSAGPVPFRTFSEVSDDSIHCYLEPTEYTTWFHPKIHVINDQHTLDSLLVCSSYDFNFNFEEYTLLIGYFYTGYGPAELTELEVDLECGLLEQYLRYEVNVDIFDKDGYRDTLIQHNAIVPKLPDGLEVRHFATRHRLYEIPAP